MITHLVGIAVPEVRVAEAARELVEAPRRVRRVVAGVAAVAVDDLRTRVRVAALVFDQVPLSCVPPSTSHGFAGLIATLMNWSVLPRFLSMCVIRSASARAAAGRRAARRRREAGRSVELHCDEMSANVPSVRITPPSEPSKIWVGFDGLTTIACWSGWIAFGATRRPWRDTARERAPGRRVVLRVVGQVGERPVVRSPRRPDRRRLSSRGRRGRSSGRSRSRRPSCCTAARRSGTSRSRRPCRACPPACRRR